MELTTLGQVIAERSLTIAENAREVMGELGAPQEFEDQSGYYCPWRIRGLGSEKILYAAGIDKFQALQLALAMIGVTLEARSKEQRVRLAWSGESRSGFPIEV